jgi:hypothetical protein
MIVTVEIHSPRRFFGHRWPRRRTYAYTSVQEALDKHPIDDFFSRALVHNVLSEAAQPGESVAVPDTDGTYKLFAVHGPAV